MPYLTKTLIISALAVAVTACSTNSETTTSPTPVSSPIASSTPSSQQTGLEGSVATSNQSEKRYAQEIQLSEQLKTTKVGETITIPVSVKNTSNFVWEAEGDKPVHFSYHWLDSNGKRVVYGGERTILPENLSPESSTTLNVTVKSPDKPGKYSLVLTMVEEFVAWFNDSGAQAPQIPVTVTSK